MKRWHLYQNSIFEGYAPNRETARRWVCGGSNYVPPEIDEKRHIKKVIFRTCKEAVRKEITQ